MDQNTESSIEDREQRAELKSDKVFESLVDSFIEDYMVKKYVAEKSGWRTLAEVATKTGISLSTLYSKHSTIGTALNATIRRGLIETRIFPGERGRAGEVMRLRIAYDREPIREFVNAKALHGQSVITKKVIENRIANKTRAPEVAGPIVEDERHRIAVLPFSSISPDANDEYFADGITEELISTISKISGLQVIARTSVLPYKEGNKRVDEIAKELKVGTILEGSVRKAGKSADHCATHRLTRQ